MIKLAQAQANILSSIVATKNTEEVSLLDALGRVAVQDIVSDIQIPPRDNSAMDGFAVNSADFDSFTGTLELAISQRIAAGAAPTQLQAGTAARIFTGAVIPQGADAVVIQENCEYGADGSSSTVQFKVQAKPKDNIRPAGQDISCLLYTSPSPRD